MSSISVPLDVTNLATVSLVNVFPSADMLAILSATEVKPDNFLANGSFGLFLR